MQGSRSADILLWQQQRVMFNPARFQTLLYCIRIIYPPILALIFTELILIRCFLPNSTYFTVWKFSVFNQLKVSFARVFQLTLNNCFGVTSMTEPHFMICSCRKVFARLGADSVCDFIDWDRSCIWRVCAIAMLGGPVSQLGFTTHQCAFARLS